METTDEALNKKLIVITAVIIFMLCLCCVVVGLLMEYKKRKEKLELYDKMEKEKEKERKRRKMKKEKARKKRKQRKLAKSMKAMKKNTGVLKALEEYLAGQTETATTGGDTESVEMPASVRKPNSLSEIPVSSNLPPAPSDQVNESKEPQSNYFMPQK
uniref:Uncharacterized protein n=1 Tax=Angiostrongylus cantonensis TaxID=6313 RepID=A0A0K0DJ17_ANGCA